MRWGTVLAGALAFVTPAWASAADTWTTPHPGVRLLRRTTATPLRIVATQIDLCHDGVSVRATRSDERRRTVSSFGTLVDADVAVNGDFFIYADYSTTGLAIGAGERWPGTSDAGDKGVVAFGRGRAEISAPAAVIDPPPAWMREVVSGRIPLIEAGAVYGTNEGDLCTARHPRTAAGLSADGRTLVLAVVDGRSSSSIGMTCSELAALMAELGAHEASNLDGGGSSAMWVAGEGVVNVPSDGSQRVVANHLGVIANGGGEPGSCDRSWEEAGLHGDAQGASTSSDIDGDGRADVCARSSAGIRCRLAADDFTAEIVGPEWSDALGWDDAANYATLRTGDIDGDGRADLCARSDLGVTCRRSESGVLADEVVGPALGDEGGFGDPAQWSTLRMADVDGDGRDDLCARSSDGFACWRSTGDGFSPDPTPGVASPWVIADLGLGFDRASQFGTIRTGDLDADGRADVCARRADGITCWPATEAGFGAPIVGPAWSDDAGWDRVEYWSTIRMIDVDGDRRADLCARASTGMLCHLSTGDGFGEALLGPAWSDESGWWDYSNYSTIRFADLDGDGDADVCARADAGIRCSIFDAGGFAESFEGPPLTDAAGWGSIRYFSTLRLADVDGDGMADLCGRTADGIACWASTGTGFATAPTTGPQWSDASGWDATQYYATLRMASAAPRCYVEERCGDGIDDNCDGVVDDGCDDATTGDADGTTVGDGDGAGGDADADGGGAGALPDTYGEMGGAEGCGCATEPRAASTTLLLLAVLGATRRRRAKA